MFQEFQVCRIFFHFFSFVFIAYADFDFIHVIQDVQPGNGEIIEGIQFCRIADSSGIQPADPAGSAGDGTEFMSRISEVISGCIQKFRGERALAYTGGVRFDDAENILHHMGSDSGPDAGAAGSRMGRSNKWIGPVIAVQHGSLGAFEKHILSGFHELLYGVVCISYIGAELFCIAQIILQHGFIVETFHAVEFFQEQILCFHIVFQFFCKRLFVHEIAHADTDTVDLICIAGSDAVLCGPDLAAPFSGFFCLIDTDMVWEYHLGAGGNLEMSGIDALIFQPFHFFEKTLRVHDYAGPDNADGAGIHNARGHQAKRICLASRNDCMTCVIAALGTNDYICLRCKIIDNLALAFIAPLGTNNHCCCHDSFFLPYWESIEISMYQ